MLCKIKDEFGVVAEMGYDNIWVSEDGTLSKLLNSFVGTDSLDGYTPNPGRSFARKAVKLVGGKVIGYDSGDDDAVPSVDSGMLL